MVSDYDSISDLGRELRARERLEKLEIEYSSMMNRKNRMMHYFNVQQLEKDMLNRPPDEIEFRDLSIVAQKYYWEKYPDRDFGERPKKEYGIFICGGYYPNGKKCHLKYGLRSQAEACFEWHEDQAQKSKTENMRKVHAMLEENGQVVSDDDKGQEDPASDEAQGSLDWETSESEFLESEFLESDESGEEEQDESAEDDSAEDDSAEDEQD